MTGAADAGREAVLQRIRTALGRDPGADPNAASPNAGGTAYRTEGSRDRDQLLDLLAERLTDYHAAVRRCAPADLAATVASALNDRQARRVVVPPGLDSVLAAALPPGVEAVADDGLSPEDLDAADGVITGAAIAIAETGTVVLDGSPGQGRRALTLVPDYHLCIVRAYQVVELVPEAVARLSSSASRPLTWISGPSATSDIELSRVEGVHGPRNLEVVLVG